MTEEPTRAGTRRGTAIAALVAAIALLIGVGVGFALGSSSSSDDDAVPTADSAAVGFAQDMIRHHEQGVEMATLALNNGVDTQVKSMAYDILTTQTNEIGQMQSWLSRWGYPVINPNPPMQWMDHDDMSSAPSASASASAGPEMSGMHDMHPTLTADAPPMPGMATDAEMAKLRGLKGRDSDVYFMQLMLRHHQGGEHMMAYAADPANVSQAYVRDLASAMQRTQAKEIKTLQTMLSGYGAAPLPMN